MAEPFYRFGEWVVPPVVAMNGTKFTFRGLENIPERGGALLAQNHTSYLDWLPPLFAARERGRRMYFMIKAEMADVKAVNFVIKHARLIPVDRSARARRLRRSRSSGCARVSSSACTPRPPSAAVSSCGSSRPARPGWPWRRRCRSSR